MTTPVEKRNNNKFCKFHGEVGHNTDECMHLKRQIEELIKAGKLSHVINELKQGSKKDQLKAAKKGEASGKDKAMEILMVQPWQRVARQRVTQSFSPDPEISFPPLEDEDGVEGPMIIEAEIGGHFIHRIYVDGGSASEILYEHCFNRLRPEVKNQMVPVTAPLIGFSGEIIWPMGQISLPIKIGDTEHSTSTWMNFVVVSLRRNTYTAKQQDNPTRVHDGLRTGSAAFLHHSSCGGKDQSSNSSRISGATIAIGSTLTEEGRKALCGLLRHNLDIFTWKPEDMTWVPRHIVEHQLNIREGCPPVRQKKRSQALERNKAIQEEVEKIIGTGIMKEVHYHS
ncbi:hypothetical protein Tco_0929002 [Tanacetum coccineum]